MSYVEVVINLPIRRTFARRYDDAPPPEPPAFDPTVNTEEHRRAVFQRLH